MLQNQEKTMNDNIKKINEFSIQTNSYLNRLTMESTITRQISSLLALTNQITREYSKYIEAINLAEHNIISPFVITPKTLIEELENYKGEQNLIMSPNSENIRSFYKLIELQMITSNDIVIFALNVPLVKKIIFDFYELTPLPIQHPDPNFYSYILPQNDHLLISQTKTQYTFPKELSDCIEYLDGKYLCHDLHTLKDTSQPSCEVELLSPHITRIPNDCETKTIRATIETWNYINNNEWIYVLQNPTTLTLICGADQSHMEDIILEKTGILTLQKHCKGYTHLFVLETSYKESKNVTHYIPRANIIDDDCCILRDHVDTIKTKQLNIIHLSNIDLSELKFAFLEKIKI